MDDTTIEYNSVTIKLSNISGCYKRCTISIQLMGFRHDFSPAVSDEEAIREAKKFVDIVHKWLI